MKRKFVSNLIFVLLLNVIIKPFYILGIDAEILRVTELQDPGTYGTYFSLLSLSFVFNILLDLGINNYNTRSVARDNERIHLRLKGTLTLKIVLAILYLLILFLTSIFPTPFPKDLENPSAYPMGTIATFVFLVTLFDIP